MITTPGKRKEEGGGCLNSVSLSGECIDPMCTVQQDGGSNASLPHTKIS